MGCSFLGHAGICELCGIAVLHYHCPPGGRANHSCPLSGSAASPTLFLPSFSSSPSSYTSRSPPLSPFPPCSFSSSIPPPQSLLLYRSCSPCWPCCGPAFLPYTLGVHPHQAAVPEQRLASLLGGDTPAPCSLLTHLPTSLSLLYTLAPSQKPGSSGDQKLCCFWMRYATAVCIDPTAALTPLLH